MKIAQLREDGYLCCPCNRVLGRPTIDAYAHGIEIKCPKCKQFVFIEVRTEEYERRMEG